MTVTAAEHKSFGDIRRKSFSEAQVKIKAINDADHTVEVTVTTVSVDREGEVVLPSAVAKRLAIYFLNPILLWGHKRKKGPKYALGVCLSLTQLPDGTGWVAKFRYDVDINKLAAKVWAQIKVGTQRSWSISFLPWAWVTRFSSPEEIQALPDLVRGWLVNGLCKVIYTDVEIIEISNVHIASNRDAILRSHEELIDMEVNADKPGVPVAIETAPSEPATKAGMAESVNKSLIKSKYHPKVNDIAGRLRDVAYSLEGPGWDDYDTERLPNPERVAACLDILGEIQTSMQSLLAGSNAAATQAAAPVTMAVSAPVSEKAADSEPAAIPETVEAVAKAAEPEAPTAVPAPFDRVAFAAKYLDQVLT